MKTCTKCGIEKDFSEFHKCAKHTDGRAYLCKPCAKEYSKIYRDQNKEKLFKLRQNYEKIKKSDHPVLKREQNKRDALSHKTYCFENRHVLTKPCSTCRNLKFLSAFDLSSKEKDGFQYRCKACAREWSFAYRKNNSQKEKERHAKYHLKNRDSINSRTQVWAKNNPDRVRQKARRFYSNNLEKEKLKMRVWRERNPQWIRNYKADYKTRCKHILRSSEAKRRAAKLKASVSWACFAKIKEFYLEAARLTKETGIPHEVDHIVPHAQGGTDAVDNLTILCRRCNQSKGPRSAPKISTILAAKPLKTSRRWA